MTGAEIDIFAGVIRDLSVYNPTLDPRAFTAERILRLMRADTLASYVRDVRHGRYDDPVTVNHNPDNVRLYVKALQFNDPLTPRMRQFRGATVVEQAFPMESLRQTTFYQEFLRPDDMFHGINVYYDVGDGRIVDLRVWRGRKGRPFVARDVDLLNTLIAFLGSAVFSSRQHPVGAETLTARECEIAQFVARGCTDRNIAQMLGISFSTVRTHVNRCFEKLGCANRAELSARFASTLSRPI